MKRILITLLGITLFIYANSQTYTITQSVKTPYQSTIPDTYIITNGQNTSYTNSQLTTIENYLYNYYGGATIVGNQDYRYNCHAYAWHISEGGNKVWMGLNSSTAEDTYWNDGSYIEVSEDEATKVSYHQSGNHSAIKESGEWYRSKWGAGFLVRHKLNEVLRGDYIPYYSFDTNYHPELEKKFYRRAELIGHTLITSSSVYQIEQLPSIYTVTWSLSDSYYNSNCLQQNTPSTNKCTIISSGSHDMTNATLTATIKYGTTTILTMTKTGLYAHLGFKGTYTGGYGSGNINLPNPIFTTPGSSVHIYSLNLIGASLSYSGSVSPSYWLQGYNTFDVTIPSGTLVIHVACENGDVYDLPIIASNAPYYLSFGSLGEQLNVIWNEPLCKDCSWTMEVYNSATGEKMTSLKFSGNSASVNTEGWKKGIYAVKLITGKESWSEKFVKK